MASRVTVGSLKGNPYGNGLAMLLPILFALALVVLAASCAVDDPTQLNVTASARAGGSATSSNSGASGDPDNKTDAERFTPVDAQPGDPSITPVPTPIAVPIPLPTGLLPPVALDGGGLPPMAPPPELSLGRGNHCPGVSFANPALIVWGVPEDDPDDGLWLHAGPSADTPRLRLFPRDTLTKTMTAGCQLGSDGTPWYEFHDRDGDVGYADSRFIEQSVPACLAGPVVGRRSPSSAVDVEYTGQVSGHAYVGDGPLAAFIADRDINSSSVYRLVPAEAISLVEFGSLRGPRCESGSTLPDAGTQVLEGECGSAPQSPVGRSLLVDLDRVEPLDLIFPVAVADFAPAANVGATDIEPLTTWNVYIGGFNGTDCAWLHAGMLRSGDLVDPAGDVTSYWWQCLDRSSVVLNQYEHHPQPAIGVRVVTFTVVGPNLIASPSVSLPEPVRPPSDCIFAERPPN